MEQQKMPVLFVGHGSPMNAVEDSVYSRGWAEIARKIPKPRAILAISAHWVTDGTRICNAEQPKTVYDFYGFPEALYQVVYQPPGAPTLAEETARRIGRQVQIDNSWGLDHGAWSILRRMYPQADVPVCQLSIDSRASAQNHYQIGQQLRALREQGVLIFGSGNVVHNLAKVNWDMAGGYPWAMEFDGYIRQQIVGKSYAQAVDYRSAGDCSKLAFVTEEHFDPLLYVLGASEPSDQVQVFNEGCTLGALSMTSYRFG